MRRIARSSLIALACAAPMLAGFLSPSPANEEAEERALLGLWQASQPAADGDPVRFYYFHDGGIGLVRYGKMGLTYTRTFHWKQSGSLLELSFIKTGETHRVRFQLEASQTVLHLPEDPAFPGDHRYRRDTRPRMEAAGRQPHPLARLWIERTKDRRGASGFRMYQLEAPSLDGRGIGWFHEGDMAEWSTETLSYRRTGATMELFFPVRGERARSPIRLEGTGTSRTLTLDVDPRNYWHARTYRDGGPGFTTRLLGGPLPYGVSSPETKQASSSPPCLR